MTMLSMLSMKFTIKLASNIFDMFGFYFSSELFVTCTGHFATCCMQMYINVVYVQRLKIHIGIILFVLYTVM